MPRVKTTRTVRIALWAIRIYLLVLLTLIGLKFLRVSHGPAAIPPPAIAPAAPPPAAAP
jgi:hypothetical protein